VNSFISQTTALKAWCSVFQCKLYWTSVSPKP